VDASSGRNCGGTRERMTTIKGPGASARYVDTDVILRYLLDDDPKLSPEARTCLDTGSTHRTGVEVIAEAVYVLAGVYDVPRREISSVLVRLFGDERWVIDHKEAVIRGLEIFGDSSLDFIDAWLIALHQVEGSEILTFDKQVRRRVSS
jgi:predicted nucleic-acid-binding protein